MQFEHLFQPIKIGTKTAKNRIVFPAHGVALPFLEDETDGSKLIAYQVARARGGSGLNIIGSCPVHRTTMMSKGWTEAMPNPDKLLPKLKRMADSVHEYGTLILLQLWVFGNQYTSPPGRFNWGFTAQAAREEAQEVCHEMTDDEINEIIDSFVKYTLVSKEGRFDGVEIHACHGDLVQQSWSPQFNRRTDKWGEQMAFSTELVKRMKAAAGKDFIIGVRMTGDDFLPGGMDNAANQKVAQSLENSGAVDLLNVSYGNGGYSYTYTVGSMYVPPASISVPLASGIKQVVKSIPVIAVGRINEPTLAENAIADGHCDMVGFVRGQIADPEFGNKAREGRVEDIRLCIACNQGCWDGGVGILKCTQNFVAGKETEEIAVIKPAPKRKKVIVVGGGPGGMEAARVAALRGHEVTLYEKEPQLGGQINTLSKAPGREEFNQVTRYLSTQLPKLGVKIKLGVEATPETIKKEQPDAVIVATGSRPYIEHIPGSDQTNVVNPSQVLNGQVAVGEHVLIYDSTGQQEGPTVADFLAERGKKVELVTHFPTIAAYWGVFLSDSFGTHLPIIWPRLKKNGVVVTTLTTIKGISGKTVTVADVWSGEERTIDNIDTVIMATGYRVNDSLYQALKNKVPEMYIVGDCAAPKRALDAIHSGYGTAFSI
jgi:2,4-dienoyl-CoA reductase-like NADH-dependent reductase (Old Yellow Enzyme family)/thioredoxin reductase